MAADKKNSAAPKDESVADILNAIKDIVEGEPGNNNTVDVLDGAGDDDEFLELTDIVEEISEEQPINVIEPAINKAEDKPLDILDEIDNALAGDAEPEVEDQKAVLEELMKTLMPEAEKAKPEEQAEPKPEEAAEEVVFAQVSEFDEIIQDEVSAEPELVEEIVTEPAAEEMKVEEQVVEEKPEVASQNISTPEIIQPPKHLNPINTNLLSAEKAQKSHLAIQNLLNNIPKPEILSPAMRNGTTIEDIVVESMKPLLKEWLDQNLEIIVRDIVEREIKKLIPHE
jgi:cell pole-organizing protein PopZ